MHPTRKPEVAGSELELTFHCIIKNRVFHKSYGGFKAKASIHKVLKEQKCRLKPLQVTIDREGYLGQYYNFKRNREVNSTMIPLFSDRTINLVLGKKRGVKDSHQQA